MKILAIEKELPGATTAEFKMLAIAEARRVWMLHKDGVFREVYFHAEEHIAVIMMECESVEHARDILDTLPMVGAGLIAFDLLPLKTYDGFERLFSE